MQYNIELGNHCFGPIVRINNSNIMIEDYDDYKLNQELFNLIFSWLKDSINQFQKDELEHIAEMLHYRQNKLFSLSDEEYEIANKNDEGLFGKFICQKFNYDTAIILQEINNSKEEFDLMNWKYILEYIMLSSDSSMIESEFESCDQCGNPNSLETYILTTNE
jgi:hypothetical protein